MVWLIRSHQIVSAPNAPISASGVATASDSIKPLSSDHAVERVPV